jgi:branched-chain amino acid transport system substrate-binding protein
MRKMSKKGITTTMAVLAMVVALVVGAGAGYLLKGPDPELQAQLDEKDATIAAKDATIDDLQDTIDEKDATIAALEAAGLQGEVKIGALMSMSGRLATFGENELLAAEFAAEHVNELLAASGADWTLKIEVEDTQTDPAICLEKVESFNARGIKLLVGPLSSSELGNIMGYLDENEMLAISQSSTAGSLAIPDDFTFRFCPGDILGQGPAIGRIMWDDGVRYVVPCWSGDDWGDGLKESTEDKFVGLGGEFDEGIRYVPTAPEFSAEASQLNDLVTEAIAAYGADQVGVLNIAFEEVTLLFTACSEYPALSSVTWYGSDGTATSQAMLDDTTVAAFAAEVSYPCTIFAPSETPKYQALNAHGHAELGRELDSYSYAVYDVVLAYAYSLMVVDTYDAEAVKEVLPTVTESLYGASGNIQLDAAGDRKAGDYYIWTLKLVDGEYTWVNSGKYVLATDSASYT